VYSTPWVYSGNGGQGEVGLLFGRFKRFFQNREEERFQDTKHFYLNHSFTIEAVKFKTKPTIIFGLPLSNPLKNTHFRTLIDLCSKVRRDAKRIRRN